MSGCTALLLISDSPTSAHAIREVLADAAETAFEIEWTQQLSEGLERLRHGGIAAVLLDLLHSDGHGIDPYDLLRMTAPDVPILILSSVRDKEHRPAIALLGAHHFFLLKNREYFRRLKMPTFMRTLWLSHWVSKRELVNVALRFLAVKSNVSRLHARFWPIRGS